MEKAKAWFENFWYHYKWMTIIVLSSVIALTVCLVQCSKKEDYTMYALYAGHLYIGGEQSNELTQAIGNYTDGNTQNISVNSFVYVSKDKKAEYEAGGAYYNEGMNMQQRNDFFDFLYAANFNMLILDPELYSQIKHEEIIKPMSEISDSAAAKSEDGYCIRLSDTSLPEKYSVFSKMSDDTVLCFREKILMQDLASKNNFEKYNYQLSVFKKMIEDQK